MVEWEGPDQGNLGVASVGGVGPRAGTEVALPGTLHQLLNVQAWGRNDTIAGCPVDARQ